MKRKHKRLARRPKQKTVYDRQPKTSSRFQYLVQRGQIDGDSIPVYVADSQEAALERVKLLIAELTEGFDYEQQDAIEKGETDASEKYDLVLRQDRHYGFWCEHYPPVAGDIFISILEVIDGRIDMPRLPVWIPNALPS